ncbi:MAG: thioesterase family protein [Rhodospirillales bacterium]
MTENQPFSQYRTKVQPGWIDCNGHMNVPYYVLAFDQATDSFFDHVGVDESYRQETNCSIFVAETHVNYLRELHEGAPLYVTTRLLDLNEKRVHLFHQMFHEDAGYLAASTDIIIVHVDLGRRRSVDWGEMPGKKLQQIHAAHGKLTWPDKAGRQIGIKSG